ncbi:MAG: DNA polymerase III subunit [Acidimicrobiia bacterium]|nr:DNA polymerase III subunit [Acidimicrobiia bacterium]
MSIYESIIGHQSIVDLLVSEGEHPAQSYLFVGPQGVGKATVARVFAGALLGGTEDIARRVSTGVHPDLILVEPDGRTSITVDQARETVALASRRPVESDRKVFLFEDGGMMTDEAANALLKTIEEPTASTVFLLVMESEDDVPSTIASRCRTIVFGRVPEAALADELVRQGIEPEQATQAARISGGRPGLALALATRPDVAAYRRTWLEIPTHLPEHPGDAMRLADEVIAAADPLLAALKERQSAEGHGEVKANKERHDRELKRAESALFTTGLEILASFYRDTAAAQLGAATRNSDLATHHLTLSTPQRAVASASRVLGTIELLESNQKPRLAFAALFADLGSDAR